MKGKIFLIIGIVLLSVIILVGSFYLFVLSGAIFMFNSNPPAPEITYGEFPIKVTCEINGEIKVIEDTVICEFDGFENLGSAGKYRKWKTYLKSTGKDMITLYDTRSNNDFTDWGNQILELCFHSGNAEYYMGDIGSKASDGSMGEWIDYLYLTPKGEEGYSAFKLDEAWEKYRIRIISWEPSPPIQNTFK